MSDPVSSAIAECARAICESYGDNFDDQPKDLATLRAERSRQRGGKPFNKPDNPGVEYPADAISSTPEQETDNGAS